MALMRIVPPPEAVGVPERMRVDVLKLIPAGRLPTAAYVGVGSPSASGTAISAMTSPTVQDWESPRVV